MDKDDFMKYTADVMQANGVHIDDDFYQYMNDRYADLLAKCTNDYVSKMDLDGLEHFIVRLIMTIARDETCILRLNDIAKDPESSSYFVNDMALRSCAKLYIDKVMSIHNKALKKFKSDYKDGRDE